MGYLTSLEPFATGLFSPLSAFDRLWAERSNNESTEQGAFMPRVDVLETQDAYVIEVELAGVDPQTVDVSLLDDTLTILGERPARARQEGERLWRQERSAGKFERRFSFPVSVDADHVEAKHTHGLLTIRVAKAPETQPRKIAIQ